MSTNVPHLITITGTTTATFSQFTFECPVPFCDFHGTIRGQHAEARKMIDVVEIAHLQQGKAS